MKTEIHGLATSEGDKTLFAFSRPVCWNDGTPIFQSHHDVFDAMLLNLAGGYTALPVADGCWRDPETGIVYKERMQEVRVLCTGENRAKIIREALTHYQQEAIFWYVVSNYTVIEAKE